MENKVLILGATGTMGNYLTQKMVDKGYRVDAVSLDCKTSDNPRLDYIQTRDAMDPASTWIPCTTSPCTTPLYYRNITVSGTKGLGGVTLRMVGGHDFTYACVPVK